MSGESNIPTAAGAEGTDSSAELPHPESSARRTPDESTLGLPSSDEPLPSSSGGEDLQRLQPNELLAGRFTILRFIARGGMGAVYEANDVMLRSRVALKVIRGRIATDGAAMERFRREVLLARRVGHPNVCHVYELFDATTAAGVPIHFLTMELLEGETLSQRIARQGRLPTTEARPLVKQMCDGLAAAHAEGVIHRDFKSSNVMLVSRGDGADTTTRVAITDFGIARAAQLATEETQGGPLTGGAAVLGTPEYMAPEQVAGGPVTQATDIYALGVVLYEMVTGKLPFTGETPLVAAAKRLTEAPPRPEDTTPGLDIRWSATILRCLTREPERRFKSASDIVPELERPVRRRPRLSTVNTLVLAGLAVAVAVVGYVALGTFQQQPPQTAVPAAPRPVVAILGFRSEVASPELAWLPTAVSESLGHELAAAETALRVIPGDRVAQVRRSLGVSEQAVSEEKARPRMQGLLAANVLVSGTLKPMAQGPASVGLTVRMVDAVSGHELASFEEDLGEGAQRMGDKVSSIAERLRETLGVSLSQEERAAVSASRARKLSATKSYAEGVMSLRTFDYGNARSSFEAALASDGNFLDAQRRVVETWEHEGNRKKAREAAERIRSKQTSLTSRQLAELDAKLLSLGPEPGKGSEAQQALFDATPDDVELALRLVDDEVDKAPKTASATVSRLRELPAPPSGDIRLDRAEAAAAWRLGEDKRATELLARMKARAQALGARTEVATALAEQAAMAWRGEQRAADAEAPLQGAASLLAEVGELDRLAQVQSTRAVLISELFPTGAALKAAEDSASLYRKLGDRAGLAQALLLSASELGNHGDIQLATRKLSEASAEFEAIRDAHAGERPEASYTYIEGSIALAHADMEGVWNAVRMLRTQAKPEEGCALCLEAVALTEQDRLPEARETLQNVMASEVASGRLLDAWGSQFMLCALTCEEGQPVEGLACFAQHPPPAGAAPSWTQGMGIALAKCRFATGDFDGAERAALEARTAAERLDSPLSRAVANAYLMRVRAVRGETVKAIANLRADLAEAEKKQARALGFELALVLGEVELQAGRPEARPRLLKLEQEAKSREFFRVARLAREALDGKSAAASGLR